MEDKQEYKIYHIYELLSIAAEWMENPDNKEAADAFQEMQEALVIKDYMPIAQKEILLKRVFADVKTDEHIMPYTASIIFEIIFTFDCLLAYVVNLDPNIDDLYKDATFYDLLKVSGILSHIKQYCAEDYAELMALANRMLAFDNLSELVNTFSVASPEAVAELTAEFQKFRMDTDNGFLKALGNIAAFNDPLMAAVKTNVENVAYKAATSGEVAGEANEVKN